MVLIVIIAQAILAFICVVALCLSLFYKNYAEPAILSAIILLTGTLVGNLGSILGGPRGMMHAPGNGTVKIDQPPDKPVPVVPTEQT